MQYAVCFFQHSVQLMNTLQKTSFLQSR